MPHAQARILPTGGRDPYADEEVYAAVEVVTSLLRDPLFDRVREAERAGRCDRELPIVWKAPDGTLIEGTIDLAFEDLAGLTVVDFKTDRELATDLERYTPTADGLLPGARHAAQLDREGHPGPNLRTHL